MPYSYPPRFDELHSISDLHLGGVPGTQTFNKGELLAATIDHLRQKSPDKQMILVINGDAVDFLIEPNPVYLDPHGAVERLERIFEDEFFKPFWQALAQYVKTPNRWLAVTLGNHDVELALPAVRERLLHELSGDDLAARGRITLVFDGTGYPCVVAGANVLCVHGSNADIANVVDHNALRRLIYDLKYGREPKAWAPNGGTQLVIDIMNSIKKKLPLLDFLKPESKAVAAVIIALDPSQLSKIKKIAPVLVSMGRDKLRRLTGFLSAEEILEEGAEEAPPSEAEAMDQLMGSTFSVAESTTSSVDDLLALADEGLGDDDFLEMTGDDEEMLGGVGLLWDIIRKRPREKNLREALLKWLRDDNTFDVGLEDATFKHLDEDVGPEVDFLLTGHTHLEKALQRKNGPGVYFNSGTWIRLIQLTEEMLTDEDGFHAIYQAFQEGTLEALDALPGLILDRPTVVSIEQDKEGVYGELRRPALENGQSTLEPVKDTRLRTRG